MPADIEELTTFDPYNAYAAKVRGDHFRSAKFSDALSALPKEVSEFIFLSEMPHQLKDDVALPLKLTEEQSNALALLLMEVIIIETYLGDIINQISQRLSVSQETAKQIASIVVNQILFPILPQLKQMHIQKFSKEQGPIQTNQPSFSPRIDDLKAKTEPQPALSQEQKSFLPPPRFVQSSPKPQGSNVVDLRGSH